MSFYQNVVDLKADIFKESEVVWRFKMSDNGVNMCTKRVGCSAAKEDAKMPKLYKYACCTPGANTALGAKAFKDSSSTNSKNRLISAPSKNCPKMKTDENR